MSECCYSGTVSDEVASVTQPRMKTCSVALWETPGSSVYNEVSESEWKDKQVKPHQEEVQVSERELKSVRCQVHGVKAQPHYISKSFSASLSYLKYCKIRDKVIKLKLKGCPSAAKRPVMSFTDQQRLKNINVIYLSKSSKSTV